MSVQEAIQTEQQMPAATPEATAPATAAPEAAQPQETQPTDAPQEQTETRDEKGRFKGVQSRIDEITRQRHEAEREAAYWRGVANQGTAKASAVEPAAPSKPSADKFTDYGDYVEALAEWKADEKITRTLNERDAKTAEKQQAQQLETSWNERQAQMRATRPDYDAVVGGSDARITAHVAEALKDSDNGPELAYHLAKHPEVLERLNGLSQRQADREIGRLEAGLTSRVVDTPAARTSNAPTPASISNSQGRAGIVEPSDMTQTQYEAYRKKQGASWAR